MFQGKASGCAMTDSIFDTDLPRRDANYAPLTPSDFLARAAYTYPDKVAVIHGDLRQTYAQTYTRCRQLASAIRRRGIATGDTVAILAPNTPAMLEAHYGVPMAGAVLNAINTRLDPTMIGFILGHGEAKLVLVDREFTATMAAAVATMDAPPPVVWIDDALAEDGDPLGEMEYEALLESGDAADGWEWPVDEWQAICLNYTSGTTGNPKGVVYHHRGAYLNAMGNAIAFQVDRQSRYLWTLPMFHCNGWTFTWGVTAVCGTHVCLRKVEPALIFELIQAHEVTHMCGAPIVLTMLIHTPDDQKRSFDHSIAIGTGGAAPPSAVIAGMERMGFKVVHLYGLTETYGPSGICAWPPEWDGLALDDKARKMARQGVGYPTLEGFRVVDAETGADVPADGETIGEIAIRGNTVMKGYLKNPEATSKAFVDGWFRSGDLAVMHPDGYAEVKDRSKDIIISGGENISSLEVEDVLFRHPKIMEAAVVARPDEKWGETPCAFITPAPEETLTEADVIAFCRDNMAGFKIPRTIVFTELPKTSTGKIQKFVLRDRALEM